MRYVPQVRVLVVEDDPDTRENLCDVLSLDGHQFETAPSAAEALVKISQAVYHVILLDWRLPDASAETLLPQLRQQAPDTAVIVSTGVGGIDQAIMALRHGAADYIAKPVDADLLRASLRRVADQLRLKEDKARSEAAFRTLVEAAGSVIVILGPSGTISYLNPFGEQLTGYPAAELLNRNCLDALVPAEHHESAAQYLSRVVAGHSERGYELPLRDRWGRLHWLLWNVQHVDEFAGQPAILAIGQDVTARNEAEQKLLQSERLAAIGQAMTGLAHESRNALQRGQADLELLGLIIAENPEASALVRRLERVQQELHRLYEEVRQYAAPLTLVLERHDLGQIARESWELLAQLHSGKDAILEVATPEECHWRIDRFQMLNVFRNLFENSLSAASGALRVVVTFEWRQIDGVSWLTVRVSDNGAGVQPELAESAFEAFVTTKTRGTGLGLAIVRRVVEAHHGRIRLGRPERGAEVVIELPAS